MPRTILLADDSVTIRKVVELTFTDTDIRVESVGSGREALERLASLRPDLVLADVVMPGPTGYDVCRAVKGSARPVPVLLLAGTFEPFDPAEARSCGADGHMTKPFDSRTLVQRVEELLEGGAAARAEGHDDDLESMFDELAAPAAAAAVPQAPPVAPSPPAPERRIGIAPEEAPRKTAAAPPVAPAPVEPPAAEPSPAAASLTAADIDAIARAVVARLSDHVLREIAWDVVPDLAETIVRERLRDLEREP